MLLHKTVINETGIPIVWLHGFGFSGRIWQPVIKQLSARYQSIVLDLPGFGRSPSGSYMVEALTETLRQTIDHPAIWVGWSLGGLIASAFAQRYPQQVKQLITVSCNPRFVQQVDWPGVEPAQLDQFCQWARTQPAQLFKQFVRLQCLGEPEQRIKIRGLTEFIQQQPFPESTTLLDSLQWLADYDARTVWQQLSMAQLHIFGDIDPLVPSAVVDEVQHLLPQQTVVRFAQCAHQPFSANPSTFIQLIQEFMNACDDSIH
ncbi:MAG: alpha/beta fold hydrolase [Legionellales bacterium]|nr:alpha/beta fold hydrolase [Legionellales bacterium]